MIVQFVFSSNNKNCGDCGDLSIRRHKSMNWYSPVLGFLLKIRKVESANLVLFRSERGWSMFFSISIHCSAHHQYSLVDFTVHHFIIVLKMNLWSIYYKAANAPKLACLNQSHLLPGSLLLLVKVSQCDDASQGDHVSNFEASLVLLAVVVLFRRLGHFGNLEKEERFSGIYFWITSSVFVNSNLALFPRHRNYLFEQNILEKSFKTESDYSSSEKALKYEQVILIT